MSPPANLTARKTGLGYTGLDTTCTSCHEDVHRSALGATCTKCHDAGSWTVTPGFDHDTTAYPLTDKHAEVKCDKCHLDPRLAPKSDGKGHLVPVYKPVSFDDLRVLPRRPAQRRPRAPSARTATRRSASR